MTTQELLQFLATLVGGGAMGAVITMAITSWRNRLQPVTRTFETLQVFKNTAGVGFNAQLTVADSAGDYKFQNLFIVRVAVKNTGNCDYDSFDAGITLAEGDKAIHVEAVSDDRHHVVRQVTPVGLSTAVSELDFQLKPFNRRNSYQINIFVTIPESHDAPGQVSLSSPHPVRFVEPPKVAETAAELLVQAVKISIVR